jgi:hypothetical protein
LERISATVQQTGWRFPTTAEVPPCSPKLLDFNQSANLQAIKAQDEMMGSLLEVKA